MDDFTSLDATAQADLVRRGEVKPLELIEAAIGRIERLNPKLNAVVTPLFEPARTSADDLPNGPFRGVPFLVKDLQATCAGVRHTAGSRLLADFVAPIDAELVTRFRAAGLVIVGITNTPEFGILPTTEPHLFGPARNPWDPTRSTGGSSGGSAAAVAARFVPLAHANDGGGSIRIPASCCGLFGLKPTRARNPLGPFLGDIMNGLVVEHAVTLSVRDSATLLDATAGPDLGAPYWAPPAARPFRDEVGAPPGRLQIGFTTASPTGSAIHPDCVAAVRDAAALCASLGHHVDEISLPVSGEMVTDCFVTVWTTGVTWMVDSMARMTGRPATADTVEPLTWALAEAGRHRSGADYLGAIQGLQMITRAIATFMRDWDVVLTPVLAEPPPTLGSFDALPDNPLAGFVRAAEYVPFTPIANATGQPAMSVPLFWTDAGLPLGAHFIGRFGDEATLFRLAAQLEATRPWMDRRPALSL
ncbi:MAG TPA: amidase [Methylomirabilota bacterium]|nr:amidase [Methylomirabilota bacterium]